MNTYPVGKERLIIILGGNLLIGCSRFPCIRLYASWNSQTKDEVIELYNLNTKYGNYLSTLASTMNESSY